MSIIFGLLGEPGRVVSESEMARLSIPTERYATAHSAVYAAGRCGMGFQPCASHQRSEMEDHPVADLYGNVLAFDGRLDNYKEIAGALGLESSATSDSAIILSAFRRWGAGCFAHYIGDWALALWSKGDQTLYLARDHAGTRTLYWCRQNDGILWSTHLDTIVMGSPEFCLSRDYVACYLACCPIRDLTPYDGVRSIRPGHYLTIRDGAASQHSHWSPSIAPTIRYRDDAQYEDHFLSLFKQSVERRTGLGAPILAELSGGLDSTSIVCVSDLLRQTVDPKSALLDTVSYYDDADGTLDERRYFSITEATRGKTGTHLEMPCSERTFVPHDGAEGSYGTPGADSLSIVRERRFQEAVWKLGYRSILSGIGGDELLGGVPDPFPELSGYLISGRWVRLVTQSVGWSLADRSPLIETLTRTVRYTAESYRGATRSVSAPPWVAGPLREIVEGRARASIASHPRWKRTPRQLDNERSWWAVMETLPHLFPRLLARPEYRYPYLDKDFVTYLHRVPSEQLLRPGRRRSLMRRAMLNIVPREILERRRKAFQLRAPILALRQSQERLETLFANSIVAELGFIDPDLFRVSLMRCCAGDATQWQALLRSIALELWLQSPRTASGRPEQMGCKSLAG